MEMVLVNEISCAMCEKLGWKSMGVGTRRVHSFGVCLSWGEFSVFFLRPLQSPTFPSLLLLLLFFCVPQDKIRGNEDEPSTKKSEMCSDEAKLK